MKFSKIHLSQSELKALKTNPVNQLNLYSQIKKNDWKVVVETDRSRYLFQPRKDGEIIRSVTTVKFQKDTPPIHYGNSNLKNLLTWISNQG